ncbi:MAG: anaerobic ribonucleoside-triphosphate reductase activating protein [Candidatus Bathyarchaeia archaeon]|jgi:pyruvate formate lyase activating enzyme|nr:anaerobic ribonucleoside-triphosphate reductase activating protein [Candidatus Bathyarchaeota archaeon A05DMB-4]MDH7595582.1 anaerobic ribonucleoside-triphosphate reductase activating protein [Candidatus Bathyarchaeota archaeon]
MKFSGIQKTSLLDFPERVATVLFVPDCNLRCPFCHNWRIVVDPKPPFLTEETVLGILENRRKYVDAVVVTGGEPTFHKDLSRFLRKLKARNFVVKLDTNGFYPQVLEECLGNVDYVAMDVKTSLEKYGRLGAKETANLLRSIEMVKSGKVQYELRATVVPSFVDAEDIAKIGELVKGAKTFVFQQFIPDDTLDKSLKSLKPYTPETITKFADVMKDYVENVVLRL